MTLPSYIESIKYYTDAKEIYNCPIFYGFQYYNSQIRPAIMEKLGTTYELYKPIYFLLNTTYLFPDIPNESDFNKFLKDFLYKLKLDRINDDFT